jgi:hypothetical protein
MKMYVDGALASVTTSGGVGTTTVASVTSQHPLVGNGLAPFGTVCYLSDVAYYLTTLSLSQVQAHYAARTG